VVAKVAPVLAKQEVYYLTNTHCLESSIVLVVIMDSGIPSSEGTPDPRQQPPVTTTSAGHTVSRPQSANSSVSGGSSGLSQEEIGRIVAVVAGFMQPRLVSATSSDQPNPLSASGSTSSGSNTSSSAATFTTASGKETSHKLITSKNNCHCSVKASNKH